MFRAWANEIRSVVGLAPRETDESRERRREPRNDFCGRKTIVRQRKALGILHLRNLSSNGGCGITDMPLEIGSVVFLELRKPHFHAAEVCWTRSLSVGLRFFRPIRPEVIDRLRVAHRNAKANQTAPTSSP